MAFSVFWNERSHQMLIVYKIKVICYENFMFVGMISVATHPDTFPCSSFLL